MIQHTLPLIFQEYRAERLEILLRDELRDPQALDAFVPVAGGRRKAYGPNLITQVLAGNFPGAGLDGVAKLNIASKAAPEQRLRASKARGRKRPD